MTRHALSIVVAALAILSPIAARAETHMFTVACNQVTLGPVTLLDTSAFPFVGKIDLTPNVPSPSVAVINSGLLEQAPDHSVTSGTFTGTLSCNLTIDAVTVGYTRSLSLTIATSGPCTSGGHAGGCLTVGPASAEVDLAAAVGKVTVSAPQSVVLGYDATVGFIVVPGAFVDTAELVCTAGSGCGERCDDCIDDNGDGLVDYDDPDCQARANGAGAGVGDPKTAGKAVVKCGKTLQAAGTKLASSRVKHLQKCLATAFTCVVMRPGDAGCVIKARATCAKELGADAKDHATLAAKVGKACAAPALALAALTTSTGLGFASESERCAAIGVPALATVADVATCVARRHDCDAEAAIGFETPFARNLLVAAGRDPATDAPCLSGFDTDFGVDIPDPSRVKALGTCAKGLPKAGAKLLAGEVKLVQKCTQAETACVQQKPGDATCLAKAAATCGKAIAKLTQPGTGLEAKLAAALANACGALTFDELANSIGYGDRAGDCTALAAPLATPADVATCIARQHECRAERLLESETPRLHELLQRAGVTLP